MKRGSSVLPRLTASSPFKFIAWIFFLFQTSTLRPRPRQRRRAASPRKRAVATDGGSLTRSRAAKTPGTVSVASLTARLSLLPRPAPGPTSVIVRTSARGLPSERYLLNWYEASSAPSATASAAVSASFSGAKKNTNSSAPSAAASFRARALKYHGGIPVPELDRENVAALTAGLDNLEAHVEAVRQFKVPVLIGLNRY